MAQEDKAASPPNDDGNVGGGTPSPPPSPRTPVSVRDRLTKGTRILGGVALVALAAWAIVFVSHRYRQQDLAVGDMEKQYHDMIRKFGMSPVYPPREDFRVGDLFFTAFNEKHEAISRIWIGNMKGFVEQADTYAASFRARSNNVSLPREKEPGREVAQDPGKEVVKEKSPEPHVNQWLENLPIVSFPTIRGSSAGAAAFGGNAREGSVFLSDSQVNEVSIEFPNVRAHGFPQGAATVDTSFKNQFLNESCPHMKTVHLLLESALRQVNATCIPSVAQEANTKADKDPEFDGEQMKLYGCHLELVTRVFLTDQIMFSYSRNNGTGAGAGYGLTPKMPTVSAPISTVDAAGNQVQSPGKADPAGSLADLGDDRSVTRAGAAARIESNNSLSFFKGFNRAITIGFDSVTPIYMSWDECLAPIR